MPLYILVRPSKKGGGKGAKGLHDYMHKRARYGRTQSYPTATTQNPLPCYVTEEPPAFDEPGKELDPNAEVWKAYVRETTQIDEELVDAWNKSMDVILIFAALFSAISTAFVLESYKSLKQDPADASSQTLLTISQTLMFIANGSQPNSAPLPPDVKGPAFQASAKDICVNVLWFLSLSLSVAVSLISMLAKEWCLEFISGRTGPARAQAYRRQKRWDGLKEWRMQEFLVVLPSLIHLSLLLFAIGLCMFLWDVHYGVAIPVVIVTTIAASAYLACTAVPFLYDSCPYGTVLSRLVKQLFGINSQMNQSSAAAVKLIARALDWMIENCETPRVVDLVNRSLGAISTEDESIPPELFEKSYTRAVVKWRMEFTNPDKFEPGSSISMLPDRTLKAYCLARIKVDRLDYGRRDNTRRLEELVLGIQFIINSLTRDMLPQINPKNFATMQVFNRCTLIGRPYLAEIIIRSEDDSRYKYVAEVEPESLVEDLVTQLEQYLMGAADFDSAVYCTLSAGLAFALCCNVARGLTDQLANARYVLRLVRGYWLGPRNTTSKSVQQTIADNLILVTLWLFISSNTNSASSSPYASIETGLETVWAGLMHIVYSDASALKRRDITYWLYGILYLLANPEEYQLTSEDSQAIEDILDYAVLEAGIPHQIKSEYYARLIQLISDQLSTEFGPQLLTALYNLRYYSPWDDKYLLPTPDIYAFVVESLCRSSGTDHWNAYQIIACCPVPKLSPKLAEQVSSRNLIPQLSTLMDSDDPNKQVFATAQLWLFLNMSLREPDGRRSDLSILEQALLKYPGLSNNLEKQGEVAEELEDRLATLLDQGDRLENFSQYSLKARYLCRIFELMLQYRHAPLPESTCIILGEVPERLRGASSCANLEDDWSVIYSDAKDIGET